MNNSTKVKTPGFLVFFSIAGTLGIFIDIATIINYAQTLPIYYTAFFLIVVSVHIAVIIAALFRKYYARFLQLFYILCFIILISITIVLSDFENIPELASLSSTILWAVYFFVSKKFKAYCGINTTKAASPAQNIQAIDEAVIFDETPAAAQIEQPRIVKPSLEETPPQPIPQKLPNFCKHCGTILPEGENYCEICKRTLYPDPAEKLTPHYCKYCGAQYNSQATFCPDCKKRVRLFRKPTAAEVKNAAFYISIVLNLVFIFLLIFMLNKPNTAAQQPVQAQPQQNTTTSNNSAVYNAAKERAAEAKKLKEEENYAAFVKAHEYHNGMVFVKESGNYTYYHFTQSCSAIRNDLTKSVHITTMHDKEPCPLCFK